MGTIVIYKKDSTFERLNNSKSSLNDDKGKSLEVADTNPALSVQDAIIHTIAYSDLFDFPMTLPELHRYLFYHEITMEELERILNTDNHLLNIINQQDGFYCLRGREYLITLRKKRMRAAQRLWNVARNYLRVISRLPFIKFIGITGSLAVNNVRNDEDDIDLFIITEKNRLWLVHGLLRISTIILERNVGVKLCHNYMITEENLSFENHSLYTARELAQMVPVCGRWYHQQLVKQNRWIFHILPNVKYHFDQQYHHLADVEAKNSIKSRVLERVLRTRIGDIIETLEWIRMRKKVRYIGYYGKETQYSKHVFKDHRNNYEKIIIQRFQERLQQLEKLGQSQLTVE